MGHFSFLVNKSFDSFFKPVKMITERRDSGLREALKWKTASVVTIRSH